VGVDDELLNVTGRRNAEPKYGEYQDENRKAAAKKNPPGDRRDSKSEK
jgi:hypothetical protein